MPIIQHLGTAFASGGGSPFDNMGNFPNATRVGTTNVIYYGGSGSYTFTDPNGGSSSYRFTVVGGGGATTGDGGGWYGVGGAGGGGCGRGTIQTSNTLNINVAQGGASPGALGYTDQNINQNWATQSATGGNNGINRVYGRGGISNVEYGGSALIYGTGGMPGFYGYYSSLPNIIVSGGGFNGRNGGRGRWHNGGIGYAASGGGVTVSSTFTENGGTGGCAAHQSTTARDVSPSSLRHPRDGLDIGGTGNTTGQANCRATVGESTTLSGAGGGGGSNIDDSYGHPTTSNIAGAAGGQSGLASLLTGTGLTGDGGYGSNYSSNGTSATSGNAGGGHGGFGKDSSGDTWTRTFYGGEGIVVVEWLG